MRLAEVTKGVSDHLNEVSERYQVPERLRVASDTARRSANAAYEHAYRGARNAYQVALEHPRTSAAAGIVLAAAIVGGVLWYIFGNQRQQEPRRQRTRVRAGTARKRAKTSRAAAQ